MTISKTLSTTQRLVLITALGLALVLQVACGRVDDQLVAQTPTRAIMGYSHARSQSLSRAPGTRQVTDSSGVGSTCSPSIS